MKKGDGIKRMKTKKKKNKDFVKHNICPYCTYVCGSASALDCVGTPHPGDISFCLMCCNSMTWDANMKLVKFDLNSIPDLLDRNRIKGLGLKMHEFWETTPDTDGRRAKYLKKMDELNEL